MGAGVQGDDDDEAITAINVVPLVDVMLVLLVIFMVATEFVQQEMEIYKPPNVPVQLPRAASAEETNAKMLMLVIDSEGKLYLNGKDAELSDVKRYVTDLKAEGKKLEAVIAADKRLSHGQVIEVIDALRLLGVADVAINTKQQEMN